MLHQRAARTTWPWYDESKKWSKAPKRYEADIQAAESEARE